MTSGELRKNVGAIRESPLLGLWFGVCAVSAAPILIKLTHAPALAIAAYRLGFAVVLLYPAFYAQMPYTASDFALSIFAGLLLALHFATWISSLSFTSVASSIVLVSTTPIFAALIAHFFTRDKVTPNLWLAVGITLIGSVIIAWEDLHRAHTAFLGDLLALAGAITGAGYLLVGRRARRSRDLLSYIFPLYIAAGTLLFLGCLVVKTPLSGYPSSAWLYLFLLALVPTVLGQHQLVAQILSPRNGGHLSPGRTGNLHNPCLLYSHRKSECGEVARLHSCNWRNRTRVYAQDQARNIGRIKGLSHPHRRDVKGPLSLRDWIATKAINCVLGAH